MVRTFIAIKIDHDENFRNIFNRLKRRLRNDKIRWSDISKLHITLKFLGDVEEEKIPLISEKLDIVAGDVSQFSFKLSGAGVFRSISYPKVFWVGTKESEKLRRLAERIQDELTEIGIEKDEKIFRPHLTLGRMKGIEDKVTLREVLSDYKDFEFKKVFVDELIFYESILDSKGAVHKSISNHRLNEKE